ncbi:MAG: polyamine aminopropyltransferase [Acidobacteria bacterium]|nr:polyamine aminopropyltransferase [Acidobacteriota bacterium]
MTGRPQAGPARFGEPAAVGFSYAYEGRLLHEERSLFQRIEVFEHQTFGRMLVLDGLTQTTEVDEFIYHEMLAHLPLLCVAEPRRVLIVGGGDGGTLRRVLEHPTVERAVMVEIDAAVIEACRKHLPAIAAGALSDPRAELVVADGAAYVGESREAFDAILIDSSDPVGPGVVLFSPEFYRACRNRLAPGGVLAAQSGGPFFLQAELHTAFSNASTAFPDVRPYLASVPTYPGTLWSFLLAGESLDVDPDSAAARAAARGIAARYWTPEVHGGCFALPAFVRDVVSPSGPPRSFGPSPEEHEHGAVPLR